MFPLAHTRSRSKRGLRKDDGCGSKAGGAGPKFPRFPHCTLATQREKKKNGHKRPRIPLHAHRACLHALLGVRAACAAMIHR
jgi:hypothetical protein